MKMNSTSAPAVKVTAARLERAQDVLKEAIDRGAMPGASVCAFRHGQLFLHEALGTLDGHRPVTLDTVYDLASITKPMATGASLLTLVEQGKLTLTAPVTDFLTEDTAGHLRNVTVKHLLTHTSGLPAWTACYERGDGQEKAVEAILRLPIEAPGTRYTYSCLGFILLRQIIEAVAEMPLDQFARQAVFEPLELETATYLPSNAMNSRIAPTVPKEGPNAGETLTGVVHDGNARAIGGVSGNAGLFATAHDVAVFGESLRCRSEKTLFGTPTLSRIFENQVERSVGAHSLLFFAQPNGLCPAGDLFSPRAVGHSGFTGTLLLIDPQYDLTVAVLTNSVFGEGKASWLVYRRKFLNALAAAVE
ncbi:MAG: hypothetical protein OHK0029_33580 [Armatimonadaceae bacterium]